MMRRNSALREGASTSDSNASSSSTTPSASAIPAAKSLDFPDLNSANKFHQNVTSAPPINRKPRYFPIIYIYFDKFLFNCWAIFLF